MISNMFNPKILILGVWSLITRQELVYVKSRDTLGSTYTIHVKIAHRQFDPFSDNEPPLIIWMYGVWVTLQPNGITGNGCKWCYVSKSKRTAQKLSWS